MKFPSRFKSESLLAIAALLLLVGGFTLGPARAATPQAQSADEKYVLERLQHPTLADVDNLVFFLVSPEDRVAAREPPQLRLSSTFIADLVTGRYPRLKTHDINIQNAVISGELDLSGRKITNDVTLLNCRFEDAVSFSHSHFANYFFIGGCEFKAPVNFTGATLAGGLGISWSTFQVSTTFVQVQVDESIEIKNSTFLGMSTSFDSVQIRKEFTIRNSRFRSLQVSFDDLRVDGRFSVDGCAFSFEQNSPDEIVIMSNERPDSKVSFSGARFGDLFLKDSSFNNISSIDFTRLQTDMLSFERVHSTTPSDIQVQLMTFKLLRPVNADQLLQFPLSVYNPELYAEVETFLRTHGYPDEADKIFIAKKRAERRKKCNDFWGQCNNVGAWALSMFEDLLAGYGKSLQNLLWWSLGFLLLGTWVFRSEKGMRTKEAKDAEHYEGRYNPFWYSLDLFLPIIKLGEADVWTPKDYRRWANLYRKVHIIIGSLFVPIGLAAWTGIIK